MTTQPYVNIEIKNGVGIIEFFHPKSNSMPSSQLKNLAESFDTLGQNDEVKVILLKSKGERVFCAGASFDELLAIDSPEKGKTFFMGFANVINAMRKCPKIIVGCIEGKTVGGGVGIAAACDYAFATKNSSIKLSELSIGIGPFVIEPSVRRRIGLNALTELTLNPTQWRLAKWGKKKGLFHKISKDIHKESLNFAQEMTRYNLEASAEIKKAFWKDAEDMEALFEDRAATSGRLALSKFTQNTLAKIKEK
ncbi:methylglutaconyl-CoA hydratase [Flavobacteriaceae bacterium UJ101]|nr:methylglutaconyl-CoA hydratase [Flavobacteriaceae bacterium UJ101]